MDPMQALIERLKIADVEFDARLEAAMMEVDVRHFSDIDPTPFFHDRPLVFLETISGGVKTISAPHMVAKLLHHLELDTGQTVLVLGAKGGYMTALVSELVGPEGEVILLDPSQEVVEHTRDRLGGRSNCQIYQLEALDVAPVGVPGELSRVLVTGALRSPPDWLESRLEDSGFLIAPIGGALQQQLVKREKQGDELLDTELGGVVFGPVDIAESEPRMPAPQDLADLLSEASIILKDHFSIEEEILGRLDDLVANLRLLPDDLAPPEIDFSADVLDSEEETAEKGEDAEPEHPLIQLLLKESDWLSGLWPLLAMLMDVRMVHPGAPEGEHVADWDEDDEDPVHEDFVP